MDLALLSEGEAAAKKRKKRNGKSIWRIHFLTIVTRSEETAFPSIFF